MTQVQPSTEDRQILAALSARDDAGSWNQRILFRSFNTPILVTYYMLLGAVGFIILRRKTMQERKTSLFRLRSIHTKRVNSAGSEKKDHV